METNELMVDDFVKFGKRILRCKNILGHTNDIMLENGVITNVMNIEPIPLTKEILEKIGFVCTQKADEMEAAYECWSFRDGLLSIEFEPEVVMLEVHNGGENGDAVRTINYFTDNDIMCLHELQHALRLCKIEKKIEL